MGIVSAVAIACSSRSKDLAKRIEAAMSKAVLDCAAEGITDPNIIRARMQSAREAAVAAQE